MKAIETESNPQQTVKRTQHQGAKYRKVSDGRKQPIRGLWQRNERFYARLKVEDASGKSAVRWIPLVDENEQPLATVPQAKAALEKLKVKREENKLPVFGETPKFSDYLDTYFKYYEDVKDAKRESTLARERGPLNMWRDHFDSIQPGMRLHRIRKPHITSYIQKRQVAKMSGRTVNIHVIALRSVLKRAIDDGYLTALPTAGVKPLKFTTAKRELVTMADVNRLCEKAMEVSKNGQQFADYVKLMAYCGARRDETLRLKWSDVDFTQKQIVIGSDGLAKNHKSRRVDFNPALAAHLKDMKTRRAPDTEWMFPSPQRGEKDLHSKSFRETLELARAAAKMPHFGFHDCRHLFISMSVMAGIDFMTIAEWAGHQDGGILIGKVYGHLAETHKKAQALKLNFEPVVMEKSA